MAADKNMAMKDLSLTKLNPQVITIAFHFQYIMPGEYLSDTKVAVMLLARVLNVMKSSLMQTGSLIVRIGKLFYTQYLDSELEKGWRGSIDSGISRLNLQTGRSMNEYSVPLDRIFVVVISGKLAETFIPVSKRLKRYKKHPFLFGMEVNSSDLFQEIIYMFQTTAIGVLDRNLLLESAFSSIEFEPDLTQMLNHIEIKSVMSNAALNTSIALTHEK